MVNIEGLNKAEVLKALWDCSKSQGMSFLGLPSNGIFTLEMARQEIMMHYPFLYFDYVKGHVIKVDLSNNEFDPFGYDRDNGDGAAQKVIDNLRLAKEY